MRYISLYIFGIIFLSGCGSTTEPTIEKLSDKKLELTEPALSPVSKEEVIRRYRDFVKIGQGSPLYGDALRRLADLELEESELNNLATNSKALKKSKIQTQNSIRLYKGYLAVYPKRSSNDIILYQLSKAYMIDGQPDKALEIINQLVKEFPDSRYMAEAQFRRGELNFIFKKYASAEDAYGKVVKSHSSSIYYEKALYKYGWSLYKQNKFNELQLAYLTLFDRKYAEKKLQVADFADNLNRAEREILDDALRVFSLSFTYQDGAKSIHAFFAKNGKRGYEPLVYRELGDLYITKKRLIDAADTYLAYVKLNPISPYAPRFHSEAIKAYQKGGFAKLVIEAKEKFVTLYGVNTRYWQAQGESERSEIKPLLTLHIKELANHYHAGAKKSKKSKDYKVASKWYGTYLRSFPQDANAAEINFLYAETLYASSQYMAAVTEFEKTAYKYPVHAKSSEAGYAALLAYNALTKPMKNTEKAQWRTKAIASALRFTHTYPQDPRVPSVLVKASEELYANKNYQKASETANRYLVRKGDKKKKLYVTALTVYGYSLFELKQYEAAEDSFRELLQQINNKNKQYKAVYERLAAAIYKQGEVAKDAKDYKTAAYHFQRVSKSTPSASIVATAEYDAATMMIESKNYKAAEGVLVNYRKKYSGSKNYSSGVSEKLALIYSSTGQGAKAAGEFLVLAAATTNLATRRDLTWQAASLYEKAGEKTKSTKTYKEYIKKYPTPLEPAVEARFKIAETYRKAGDSKKWGHWLNEIIKADAKGGKQRTDRTKFLAANSTLYLASPYRTAYKKASLTAPIKKSLKKKKKLMKNTITAYERALKYNVAEVTTSATYEIAEVYNSFAGALMNSARPKGLSGEELEQYDILLEEQAFPFEEKAIDIHMANLARTKDGLYDKWIQGSLKILQQLQPVRYAKNEKILPYVEVSP